MASNTNLSFNNFDGLIFRHIVSFLCFIDIDPYKQLHQNDLFNTYFSRISIICKQFLDNFVLLPPSECGLFPGGIEYQKVFNNNKYRYNI